VVVILATSVGGVLTISEASQPILSFDSLVLLFLLWALIGLLWGVSAVVAVITRTGRMALIAPVAVVTTLAICLSGVPKQVAVAASDADLTSFVARAEAGEINIAEYSLEEPISVGWFRVYWIERRGSIAYLVNGFVGSDTPAGLVRLPSGPQVGDSLTYRHLYGPWYRWLPAGYD
jgi:hypothetical protein